MPDITVGETRQLRGHWSDRLADIDTDVAAIAARLDSAGPAPADRRAVRAIAEALGRPKRPAVAGRHAPRDRFEPGLPLTVEFVAGRDHASLQLHYRRVNQAERWRATPMERASRVWRATIPADCTQSPYPVQYYFEVKDAPESAGLFPGLGEHLTRQPYFVVRPRAGSLRSGPASGTRGLLEEES